MVLDGDGDDGNDGGDGDGEVKGRATQRWWSDAKYWMVGDGFGW